MRYDVTLSFKMKGSDLTATRTHSVNAETNEEAIILAKEIEEQKEVEVICSCLVK